MNKGFSTFPDDGGPDFIEEDIKATGKSLHLESRLDPFSPQAVVYAIPLTLAGHYHGG
jgi:hypothetical protein